MPAKALLRAQKWQEQRREHSEMLHAAQLDAAFQTALRAKQLNTALALALNSYAKSKREVKPS